MNQADYFQKLVWQRLIRDRLFGKWLKSGEPELKKELEDKYSAFSLRIEDDEGRHIWIDPRLIRTLTPVYKSLDPDMPRKIRYYKYGPRQPLSTKIAFEIDLEKFSWSKDRRTLIEQIREEIDAELKLREPFDDTETELHYRPQDFDRDLALLASWEVAPDTPFQTLAYKHKYKSADAARKALEKIKALVRVDDDGFLIASCSDCPKRADCKELCGLVSKELDGLTIGQRDTPHADEAIDSLAYRDSIPSRTAPGRDKD